MRTATIMFVAISLAGAVPARAQNTQWFGLTWDMSAPTAHTGDFAGSYSFRGFGMEWRWMVSDHASIGANSQWNVMDDVRTETASVGSVDVTGKQFRYVNAWPILAMAHYYFGERDKPVAFVGMNVGTYAIQRTVDVGTFEASETNWHFGFAPEIGAALPLNQGMSDAALFATVRYNYAFASGNAPYQSWFGINVGVAFRSF